MVAAPSSSGPGERITREDVLQIEQARSPPVCTLSWSIDTGMDRVMPPVTEEY